MTEMVRKREINLKKFMVSESATFTLQNVTINDVVTIQ